MSKLFSKFKGNDAKETEGVYLDLSVVRIKIARAGGGHKAFHAGMAKLQQVHGKAIANDLLPTDKSLAIMQRFYAEVIVKGWDYPNPDYREGEQLAGVPEWLPGIESPDGEILEVTPENIAATFTLLPNLWQEVWEFANTMKYFNDDFIKAVAGN